MAPTATEPSAVLASPRLAIHGGVRLLDPTPREDGGLVREASSTVAAIVRRGRTVEWGGGAFAKRYEREVAALTGRRDGFFHNSGSAALHTALFSVGVAAGDTVAIGNSGFIAALNSIAHLGARPVFLPTDRDTLVVSRDVSEFTAGVTPKASLLTHFFGNIADVRATHKSSGAEFMIEDAGQAAGGSAYGLPVGASGDVGSFAGSLKKLMTSGQGGINVFDAESVGNRMRAFAHHGKDEFGRESFPGFNYRGGEMEAALGLAALPLLEARAADRNRTAETIRAALSDLDVKTGQADSSIDARPVWFDVPVLLPPSWRGHRDALLEALTAEGVPAWTYPSLMDVDWVRPYMEARNWWDERTEETARAEREIWSRLFVVGTQFDLSTAARIGEAIRLVLTGEK